jgi:uncharacterized protein (DUF849 family)
MAEEKFLRKVIITAAVTGAAPTPTMSDYLPITPKQIADDAGIQCAEPADPQGSFRKRL